MSNKEKLNIFKEWLTNDILAEETKEEYRKIYTVVSESKAMLEEIKNKELAVEKYINELTEYKKQSIEKIENAERQFFIMFDEIKKQLEEREVQLKSTQFDGTTKVLELSEEQMNFIKELFGIWIERKK